LKKYKVHLEQICLEDDFNTTMCPNCENLLCYGFDYKNGVKKEHLTCTKCLLVWNIKAHPKEYAVTNYHNPKKIRLRK
jgi:RNase P subunit RPR2